jgi:predicted CoA-binding protein
MTFTNPPRDEIEALLARTDSIAVVGLSDSPFRTSHGVAAAMQRFGYRIIPVNPLVRSALGERAFDSLTSAARELGSEFTPGIVNVFRRSEHVCGIVEECIALGLPAIWLQEGVIDDEAATRARDAGMFVVMDRCIMKDRMRIQGSPAHVT